MPLNDNVRKVFDSSAHHFMQLIEDLEDTSRSRKGTDGFNLLDFQMGIGTYIKDIMLISSQLTMTVTETEDHNASEIQDIINGLQIAVENMLKIFYTLPKDQGENLYQSLYLKVSIIIKSLCTFMNSLNLKGGREKVDCLKSVGLIWSACEDIEKVPKDNLEASLNILRREELLLSDALQEIDEEVKNDASAQRSGEDIDNTEIWNNQDRELLPPCVGLVKTARTCLKRIITSVKAQGDSSTSNNRSQLDSLTNIVIELSPAVDNFVSTIYPPVNRTSVKTAAIGVVNIIQNLLKDIQKKHFIKEEDHQWVQFLLKAVDHNNNKLQPLLYPEEVED